MAVRAKVYSPTTSPEVVADGAGSSAQAPRSFLIRVPSTSAVAVAFGGDDLTDTNTTTDGFVVNPGDPAIGVDLSGGDKLYAVTASGTGTVEVLGIRN